MHAPGDGRFGNAEDRCRLRMGKLLASDENNRVAKSGFQFRDRALHPNCVVGVPRIRSSGYPRKHRQLFAEDSERAAPPSPIPACVEGDSGEPGREQGFAAKAPDLFDERAADILRDVVGVGSRSGELPGDCVDPVVVALEQGGERVTIAGTGSGDETGIWIAADFCPPPDCARDSLKVQRGHVSAAWRS